MLSSAGVLLPGLDHHANRATTSPSLSAIHIQSSLRRPAATSSATSSLSEYDNGRNCVNVEPSWSEQHRVDDVSMDGDGTNPDQRPTPTPATRRRE